MSSVENDQQQLIESVFDRNFGAVMAAVEAGASVDGPPEAHWPPIAAATMANHTGMVEYFLRHGADPNRPVAMDRHCTCSGIASAKLGERALHIAGRCGNVEIACLLLKRYHADPNGTDNGGFTPLMATCSCRDLCVEVVRLLLESGADPTLEEHTGLIPLHAVALRGNVDLVDMLYSRAPATLNRCCSYGLTPLFTACNDGHKSVVSKLLSMGAMQPLPSNFTRVCPLQISVINGFLGVVRVLINEGGIRAVGGETALRKGLFTAFFNRRAKILRLLLTAEGEEGRAELANTNFEGLHLLHCCAGSCHPAAVSVLLEAGADETALTSDGHIPRDVIGLCLGQEVQVDREEEVAINRMLQRGPAYRARSWAWPSDEPADACGSSGDETSIAADPAAAATAVLLPPQAVKSPSVIGVRIVRPKENRSSKIFARLIGRYCAKD